MDATRRLKRKPQKFEQHVRLHHWLMRSAAWMSLRPGPRAALVQLYSLFRGMNNGELFLSNRDCGTALNVDKDTAALYLWELEARGFIRVRQTGSFHWKLGKATTWILTEFAFGDELATKDFMSWRPGQNLATRPAPKAGARSGKSTRTVRKKPTDTGSFSIPEAKTSGSSGQNVTHLAVHRSGPGRHS